jgi:hypothetical protein
VPARSAAGDREQGEQDREEWNVFLEDRVHQVMQGLDRAEDDRERYQQGERPDCRNRPEAPMPEVGGHERDDRDRQQQPREWQSPQQRQRRAAEIRIQLGSFRFMRRASLRRGGLDRGFPKAPAIIGLERELPRKDSKPARNTGVAV